MHRRQAMSSRIAVLGGAGYIGSVLVPALLDAGHHVVVYDIGWFGFHFPHRPNMLVKRGDIREVKSLERAMTGCDVVIDLAAVSNDPSFELDAEVSKSINFDAFEPMVVAAKNAGVKRFIYASTSSVYGISDAPDVREDHPFMPITLYNRYKGECEPLLLKHQSEDFTTVILRPATVCGYSSRMRLDLSVNILTNLAVNNGIITIFGGKQARPNIHIKDMVRAYLAVLDAPKELVAGQAFNVGMQNLSINELAEIVRGVVSERYAKSVEIRREPMKDERSYRVNSEKFVKALDFKFEYTIEDAVNDICDAFDQGLLPNSMTDDAYYNVRRMKAVLPDVYKDAPESKMDHAKGVMSEMDLRRMG
eukprot:GHVU01079119.1.p1 GENE.GHVU01079119.1~~GHVU01079119.1.p1  ORF type:complete len:363 (+),score=54.74 GHVU01079119.1:751-1839(+)